MMSTLPQHNLDQAQLPDRDAPASVLIIRLSRGDQETWDYLTASLDGVMGRNAGHKVAFENTYQLVFDIINGSRPRGPKGGQMSREETNDQLDRFLEDYFDGLTREIYRDLLSHAASEPNPARIYLNAWSDFQTRLNKAAYFFRYKTKMEKNGLDVCGRREAKGFEQIAYTNWKSNVLTPLSLSVTGGSLAAALIPTPSDPSHQSDLAYDSSLNREMEVALRESIDYLDRY